MDHDNQGKNGKKLGNVLFLAAYARAWTFAACEGIQKIWVTRARDGSLRLSFVRPAKAKNFVPASLEGLDIELLAIGLDGEEHRVSAKLFGVSSVAVSVPGLPLLDEARISGTLVVADPRQASCLWFEANEGDASNVARITLRDQEGKALAWANERFPAIAVAPPPPSRRCM